MLNTVAQLGTTFRFPRYIDYLSKASILDYEFLIIDLDALPEELAESALLDQFAIRKLKERNADLADFLVHKGVPIIFFTPLHSRIRIDISQHMKYFKLSEFFPIPDFAVKEESGKNFDIIQNTPFTNFLQKYKDHFAYTSYFQEPLGKVIAQTPHKNKAIGFYNKQCIFLPSLGRSVAGVEEQFLLDLVSIVQNLSADHNTFDLPIWAKDIYLPGEKGLNSTKDDVSNEIDALQKKMADINNQLFELQLRKRIFTSQGQDLETEVKWLFGNLGFEILESEKGRDDLKIKLDNDLAILEIKGVGKSAAEKYAAQLEKWSALYIEETGCTIKPILLVNAFREIPLEQRVEATFPNQMLRYSESRDHCLISTLQLLVLYHEVKAGILTSRQMFELILNCKGIFTYAKDWRTVITIPQSQSSDSGNHEHS